jgi:hypothetical protein
MKKIFIIQIILLISFSTGGMGLLIGTDIYDNIRESIVITTCLSCIKMDPISIPEFTFITSNGQSHPNFVYQNITKGVIFIEYREDVCKACDDMAPIIKNIFNLEFNKEDIVFKKINYGENDVVFLHINRDHASDDLSDSFFIYDKDNRMGVPMFTVITVGNNSGKIEPYYTTVYGTLSPLKTDEARMNLLEDILKEALSYYDEYINYYEYETI